MGSTIYSRWMSPSHSNILYLLSHIVTLSPSHRDVLKFTQWQTRMWALFQGLSCSQCLFSDFMDFVKEQHQHSQWLRRRYHNAGLCVIRPPVVSSSPDIGKIPWLNLEREHWVNSLALVRKGNMWSPGIRTNMFKGCRPKTLTVSLGRDAAWPA